MDWPSGWLSSYLWMSDPINLKKGHASCFIYQSNEFLSDRFLALSDKSRHIFDASTNKDERRNASRRFRWRAQVVKWITCASIVNVGLICKYANELVSTDGAAWSQPTLRMSTLKFNNLKWPRWFRFGYFCGQVCDLSRLNMSPCGCFSFVIFYPVFFIHRFFLPFWLDLGSVFKGFRVWVDDWISSGFLINLWPISSSIFKNSNDNFFIDFFSVSDDFFVPFFGRFCVQFSTIYRFGSMIEFSVDFWLIWGQFPVQFSRIFGFWSIIELSVAFFKNWFVADFELNFQKFKWQFSLISYPFQMIFFVPFFGWS